MYAIVEVVTDDGEKNLRRLGNKHGYVDDHAMWIDPDNTNYSLVGGDGGLYEFAATLVQMPLQGGVILLDIDLAEGG